MFVFSIQLTVNKIAIEWIRTMDLRGQKWPRYQATYNHCPFIISLHKSFSGFAVLLIRSHFDSPVIVSVRVRCRNRKINSFKKLRSWERMYTLGRRPSFCGRWKDGGVWHTEEGALAVGNWSKNRQLSTLRGVWRQRLPKDKETELKQR